MVCSDKIKVQLKQDFCIVVRLGTILQQGLMYIIN